MKKFTVIMILAFVAFVSIAQERTVPITFKTDVSYIYHKGAAADTLKKTNQDTIDFLFTNQNHGAIEKLVFTMSIDTLAGNDSIYYTLSGLNNSDGAATTIASGGILVNQSNEIVDISKWYWTNDTTYVDLNYRFYRLRFIQDGNNDYDGGAKFDYLIGKLYFK
jgi:hypothetical protein